MFKLFTKRVYEKTDGEDGYRVLVDRLWPRGVSKEEAKLDEWAKEIAPSNELRKSFDHEPDKMADFKKNIWRSLRKIKNLMNSKKVS